MYRKTLAAGVFAAALVASACGSNTESTDTTSSAAKVSSSAATTPSASTSTSPALGDSPPASPASTPGVTPPAQPDQDDDPGGHPCTDQSGAPGHLIAANGGVGPGWVCEITGDAPQADVDRHAGHDDDPGGHPCTDASGTAGFLIPGPGGDGGWVCNTPDPAPAPQAPAPQAEPQVHDDDPGGYPCTDASGAPGILIAGPGGDGGWVCSPS